jgi:YYY domain-containing protein
MDFTPILIWWLILWLFGLAGWPLAFNLLRHLPDRGFAFARPVGFLLSGYILWLGATFRLLKNDSAGLIVALLIALTGGWLWSRRQRSTGPDATLLAWLRREWRYALAVELLFALAFVAWSIYKAYNPNIETAGGEKWMEITFINGILRSDYFPPQDPWLSGFGISYYYFGYVMMAGLTQLSGLVSTTAFNLYIPTLFAMTLAGAFGLAANLVALYGLAEKSEADTTIGQIANLSCLKLPALVTGLAGALLVALIGNLIGLLEVLHKRGLLSPEFWRWLDILDLKEPPLPSDTWIPDRFIWWWRGSRVLTDYNLAGRQQELIDEFPFFSFLLGDVHPHVLALPFVLLAVALALNLFSNPAWSQPQEEQGQPKNMMGSLRQLLEQSWRGVATATGGWLAFLLYALAIGGLSFLNTWDFPIYLSLVGLVLIAWLGQRHPDWQAGLLPGLLGAGMLGLAGIVLYLPFYVTFQSQARGILPNLWNPTRLPQFFVFFGLFLFALATFLLLLSSRHYGWQKQLRWTMPLTIAGPALSMLIILSGLLISPAGRVYIQDIINNPEVQAAIGGTTISTLVLESLKRRVLTPWTFLFLGGLSGWVLAQLIGLSAFRRQPASTATPGSESPVKGSLVRGPYRRPVEIFVLILLLVGLGLPLAVEFVYLRDNFGYRINSIFKFYFQAWLLLALASAFALYYVTQHLKGAPALAWYAAMLSLVAGAMLYPVLAIANKTNNFQNEPTLDGIAWISHYRPGDYAAIQWLREHGQDGEVVLEAPGSHYAAYQYTGRVSAMTGLPTLLGWGGHQSQWRGNYDEPARREPEIDLIFNTSNPAQAQQLLDKYNVTYVYVGPLERERYSPQGLRKFEKMMAVAFQKDDVTIYQRNPLPVISNR